VKKLKILVAGHFGAGKSTFVKNASEKEALSLERKTTDERERAYKRNTTVAMDFGETFYEEEQTKLAVFGIPGQDRFSFMWPILSKGTDGYVFLLDSTKPELWDKTLEQIRFFMAENPAPYIVLANKQDLPDARSVREVRQALDLEPGVKVLPCIATDKDVVKQLLNVLVEEVRQQKEALVGAREVSP